MSCYTWQQYLHNDAAADLKQHLRNHLRYTFVFE